MPTPKGEERTGFLLPHEIFSHIYENNRAAFNKLFIPDGPSSLRKIWSQCRGAACLQNQPVLDNLNPSKCIPIAVHGDEVPTAGRGKCWVKMALVFTWFSLVANQMPTKVKRICEPQPGGSQHIYFFILSSFWLSFILHYHYHFFIIFKFIIIFLSSSNSLSFCICIGCMSNHNLLYVENIVYNYLLLSVSVR